MRSCLSWAASSADRAGGIGTGVAATDGEFGSVDEEYGGVSVMMMATTTTETRTPDSDALSLSMAGRCCRREWGTRVVWGRFGAALVEL